MIKIGGDITNQGAENQDLILDTKDPIFTESIYLFQQPSVNADL